jgi:hypothetical protein
MTVTAQDAPLLMQIDQAAGVVLDYIAGIDDVERTVYPLFVTAFREAGYRPEDLAAYAECSILLDADEAVSVKPWQKIVALVRSGIDEPTARRQAVEAVSALRDVLTAAGETRGWTVTALDAVEIVPVTYAPGDLAQGVVYASGLTTLAGHGESGKSTLAQAIALDALRAGTAVIHLDYEQGPERVKRKYAQLGATPEEQRRVRYVWRPEAITADRLTDLAAGDDALVLVDSFSKASTAAGLSGTDWQGHGDLADMLNAWGVDNGDPVLLIDHLNGSGTRTEKHAAGSTQKYNAAAAQWTLSVSKKFNERRRGEVVMVNVKARDGQLDDEVRIAVGGDGPDVVRVERVAAGQTSTDDAEARVLAFLGSQDKPVTKEAIREGAAMKKARNDEAVERLLATGLIAEVPGGRYPRYKLV